MALLFAELSVHRIADDRMVIGCNQGDDISFNHRITDAHVFAAAVAPEFMDAHGNGAYFGSRNRLKNQVSGMGIQEESARLIRIRIGRTG